MASMYDNSTSLPKAADLSTSVVPPTYITSDYIQMTYLILVFVAGAPLNLYTFFKLSRQYHVTKSRILLLSLHLNISDLMILFFYAFAKICWLSTYRWMAGLIMCKIIKFAQSLSFTLSSNVIVCIGMDRLFSLMNPLQIKPIANWRCKQMLLVAWVMAVIFSAPQLHVWTIVDLTSDWAQCTDIWQIWEYHNLSTSQTYVVSTAYNSFHLVVIFWLPLTIVTLCYTVILKKVYKSLGDDHHVEVVHTRSSGSGNQESSSNSVRRHPDSGTNCTNACNKDHQVLDGSVRSIKASSQQQPLLRRNAGQLRIKRTKYRTLKITILIVIAYVIFWLPYNVLAIWGIFGKSSYRSIENYVYFFYGLIAVNAVINPLIYSRLSLMLCGRRKKQTNRNGHAHDRRPSVRFMIDNNKHH